MNLIFFSGQCNLDLIFMIQHFILFAAKDDKSNSGTPPNADVQADHDGNIDDSRTVAENVEWIKCDS